MPLPTRPKEILLALFGIPLLCTLIIFGLISTADPLFQDWENKTLDYRFKLRGNIPFSPEIALIDIDDRSISSIGRWPWPREKHAEMINILSESRAAVIGYDILFHQNAKEIEDQALQAAIKKAGNVYLPTGLELTADPTASSLLSAKREIGPITRLREVAAGIGHISSNRDADGTIRRVPLLVQQDGLHFPAFTIALLQGYLQNTQPPQFLAAQQEIHLQNNTNETLRIPVDETGRMRINYAGPWVSTFSHYPFADIWQAWQNPEDREALKQVFAGKIVLVSNTATGYDLKPVPFESDYPGGGIHANILNTILTGQYLRTPGALTTFVISLLLSIVISTVIFYKKGQVTLPVGLAIGLLYLGITYFVFTQGINLPVLFPILTITVTSLSLLLYQKNLSMSALRQLTHEKNQVSEKFHALKIALKTTQETLILKRNALAQMMLETTHIKGKERTRAEQIMKLRDDLEKSEQQQARLLLEKDAFEVKINQFSIAKINNNSSTQPSLEPLRKEAAAHGLITKNRALLEDFARIKKVAHTTLPVLILGETGTGKELIARMVHAMNRKTNKALVTVNTPAIPDTLFDSTLFGYVKGAFAGANVDKRGKFQEANGGTLFLDEIGEIPPELQVKLLRAIETGEVDRVGASRPDHVNVRIISATNRNLIKAIEHKQFRSDLFFRLAGLTVNIPPLRERKEDLEALIAYFLERSAVENGRAHKQLSKDALQKIKTHDWPGNVRELKTRINRAFILADKNPIISAADLELDQVGSTPPSTQVGNSELHSALPRIIVSEKVGKDLSDAEFLLLLKQHDFNKTRTAEEMEVNPLAVGSRFRGICLKTFDEQGRDAKKTAAALSAPGEDIAKMEKIITDYYHKLIKSVKDCKDREEAVKKCETNLFRNIKKKYRDNMIQLVQHYFESLKGPKHETK